MVDNCDVAETEIALQQQLAIERVRRTAAHLTRTGYCHNCEGSLPKSEQLFCDENCREDFSRTEWANRMRR